MCPDSPPEAFVDHYLVLIPCQSFGDFQKMLDLKGVKRQEQNNLLDIFLARTSLLRDLQDTSILTSIEMDGTGSTQMASNASGSGITLGSGLPTSPNSALAHNLNLFMGSLPMLHGAGGSTSQGGSRSGTPSQSGYEASKGGTAMSAAYPSQIGSPGMNSAAFGGLKKFGRLFSGPTH